MTIPNISVKIESMIKIINDECFTLIFFDPIMNARFLYFLRYRLLKWYTNTQLITKHHLTYEKNTRKN
jgi:hypothetical protein